MNPEERQLLERSLRLSEENNRILMRIEKRSRRAMVWGFIKMAAIVIPLVLSIFYLEPYLDKAVTNYKSIQDLIGHMDIAF
ncbi:hypothetical protein KW784_00270 [Candidatus Parcubacteria bacterium]|nr:hypothetical protein [Candidatus Parcubacteria bacterium]